MFSEADHDVIVLMQLASLPLNRQDSLPTVNLLFSREVSTFDNTQRLNLINEPQSVVADSV
jgi:hypothetical protein